MKVGRMQDRISLLGAKDETVDPITLQRSSEPPLIAEVWAETKERKANAIVRGDAVEFPVTYIFRTHYSDAYLNTRFIDMGGERFRLIERPSASRRNGEIEFRAVKGAGI